MQSGKQPADERFPAAVLVCCPNLTVRERLQVLRPEAPDNYYTGFDLVPSPLRPLLQGGRVLIVNWHKLALEGEHVEGGKSYAVVQKGEERPEAFARRVLGALYERAPLLVLNDEGHHCYRPKLQELEETAGSEAKEANEEAGVWVRGRGNPTTAQVVYGDSDVLAEFANDPVAVDRRCYPDGEAAAPDDHVLYRQYKCPPLLSAYPR